MPRKYVKRLGSRPYCNYSKETLQNCLEAIRSGMPKLTASSTYGIPVRTLTNKLKGGHEKKPGGQVLFTPDEESSFVNHLLKLSEYGFPISSNDLRYVVASYLNKKGKIVEKFKNNVPGKEWAKLFVKRHHTLSNRFVSNIKTSRVSVTKDDITSYINNLKETVHEVPPTHVWNFDETNLSDDPKSKKLLVKRGTKYPENICNFSKSSFSVMFCVNGEGGYAPPYVIYKAEHLWTSWYEGGPKGCRYNRTKNGWFDANTFEDWFVSHMLPILKKQTGRKVLIGDNLSSHINENVINLCEENNIRFACLPPNTSHLTQPLDVSVFSSMKKEWRQLLSEWRATSEGLHCQTLPKEIFAKLLKKLMDVMIPKFKNIVPPGFKKCGICPVNADEILSRIPPGSSDNQSPGTGISNVQLAEEVGQSFIEHLQKRRGELAVKPRAQRKKLTVPPGKSICPDDFTSSSSGDDTDTYSVAEPGYSPLSVSEEESASTSIIGEASVKSTDRNVTVQVPYCVGDYVVVRYNNQNFPGQVTSILQEGLEVKCLEKGKKAWKWPNKEDKLIYEWDDVKKISADSITEKRGYLYIKAMETFV